MGNNCPRNFPVVKYHNLAQWVLFSSLHKGRKGEVQRHIGTYNHLTPAAMLSSQVSDSSARRWHLGLVTFLGREEL